MGKSHNRKIAKELRPVPLVTLYDSRSEIAEQYRMLRSNLRFATRQENLYSIIVTSTSAGEGKSTTVANVAVVFADAGFRTLLVDADMRRPTVALTFGLSNDYGLSDLLENPKKSSQEVIEAEVLPNLAVLSSGALPSQPADLLASKQMAQRLKEWRKSYDLIFFDTPPLLAVPDAQILSAQVDGTLLVVREGKTSKERIAKAKELLNLSGTTILGVVYNAATQSKDQTYGYRYR